MTDKTFSFKRGTLITLLVPAILCIGAFFVLFYRVDMLEKNSISNRVVYDRLLRLEVQMENVAKQLNRLLEVR